jgi:hypothetical protein
MDPESFMVRVIGELRDSSKSIQAFETAVRTTNSRQPLYVFGGFLRDTISAFWEGKKPILDQITFKDIDISTPALLTNEQSIRLIECLGKLETIDKTTIVVSQRKFNAGYKNAKICIRNARKADQVMRLSNEVVREIDMIDVPITSAYNISFVETVGTMPIKFEFNLFSFFTYVDFAVNTLTYDLIYERIGTIHDHLMLQVPAWLQLYSIYHMVRDKQAIPIEGYMNGNKIEERKNKILVRGYTIPEAGLAEINIAILMFRRIRATASIPSTAY